MNSDKEKYKAYALSVSEKWSLEEVRSAFVAEYADRRVFFNNCCRLWKRTLTLSGKIGALRKKIKKLEQGNIAKARAIPLRNCDVMDWRTAWAKWRTELHPQKPCGYAEVVSGTEQFMDWYMSEAKGGEK